MKTHVSACKSSTSGSSVAARNTRSLMQSSMLIRWCTGCSSSAPLLVVKSPNCVSMLAVLAFNDSWIASCRSRSSCSNGGLGAMLMLERCVMSSRV